MRGSDGSVRTYYGVEAYGKKHQFDEDGKTVLLNQKELKNLGLKNKQTVSLKVRKSFSEKTLSGEIIILRVTSKKFKKLYALTCNDFSRIKIKEKYKYDVLLFKALQYAK